PADVERFSTICDRERCPFAVVGEATQRRDLTIDDDLFGQRPVDIPLDMMLGKMPALHRHGTRTTACATECDLNEISLSGAVARVLQLPAVADKSFLITIGDRTVGGMIARDQMVGPWQVPVADCAVTLNGYTGFTGEAMSIGERSPLAVHNAPASGRMAVAEALTNLAAAYVPDLSRVVLSANWMAACGDAGEDAALFDTVRAVGMELCPALGIAIPVGKDSLSMQANWNEDGDGESNRHSVRSPVSLIVSAFAPVQDVRRSLTPQLDTSSSDSILLFIDVSGGKSRMGGSALAQVFRRHGGDTPDVDSALVLKGFLNAIQTLNGAGHLLAYHDRSDGGLFTTLCEMAFASHCGLDISLDPIASPSADNNDLLRALFNEELGAVIQIPQDALKTVMDIFDEVLGLRGHVHPIARCTTQNAIIVRSGSITVFEATRTELHLCWSETSYRMVRERDNPACADEARAVSAALDDPGLVPDIQFTLRPTNSAPAPERPRVAILREQGVNGHLEMAAAFEHAGFSCYDVHMTDIINAKVTLDGFSGLVACGGFSYGDVLGAGGGWANSIRFNDRAGAAFESYFARSDTFTLGVCNGCQMLAHLTDIIPGTEGWPTFIRNRSEQFEARLVMCEIPPSPSIFFQGMEGSRLPVAIAHGEGRAQFRDSQGDLNSDAVCMRFVDHNYAPATTYPLNPNGSVDGITGLTNTSGQVTIMMPHPERTFRTVQYSWHPADWKDDSPWMQMFWNARHWVG
ncbi:MAG: phosphoribosylformylglycinamidine synthase, partial [Gammaproteobacteria bacterium]